MGRWRKWEESAWDRERRISQPLFHMGLTHEDLVWVAGQLAFAEVWVPTHAPYGCTCLTEAGGECRHHGVQVPARDTSRWVIYSA